MKDKETKNKQAEELSDETLDEVTGGVYQSGGAISRDVTVIAPQPVPSKKPTTAGGGISVPTAPTPGGIRKF